MSNQKQHSVTRDYQFEKDGSIIQGTLELTIEKEGETITGVTLTLSGDSVTDQARQAADALAQTLLEHQSVDALTGATPVEAVEEVQKAAVQCLDQFTENAFIGAGDTDDPARAEWDKAPSGTLQGGEGAEPAADSGQAASGEEIGASSATISPAPAQPEPAAPSPTLFFAAGFMLCAACAAALWLIRRNQGRRNQLPAVEDTHHSEWVNKDGTGPAGEPKAADAAAEPGKTIQIGQVHHIGARPGQQDSLGVTQVPGGVLAVVADGMGGLADGDKVSQTIVRTMLGDAGQITQGGNHQKLYTLAAHANRAVLSMLGPARQYQCGSTLIAVLLQDGLMQWLSIGDSHIYLYRGGVLLQLNREHTLEQELLLEAANGRRTVSEIYQNPKRKGLTSFVGMGELKHTDSSTRPLRVQPGDRILLMTDGVFNTLSDAEMEAILAAQPNPARAAAALEQLVLAHKNPKQDNFTAILLYL